MPVPSDCPETDIDLWADAVLRNPYPSYEVLRSLGPVVWMSRYDAYALTRYEEVRTLLQDWESFTSAKGVGMDPRANARSGRGILTTDPPLHDTRRAILNRQLMPHSLTTHRADIEERADEMIAGLVARGSFDVVADLAQPYSVGVVADLVGLPTEQREHLLGGRGCVQHLWAGQRAARGVDAGFLRLVRVLHGIRHARSTRPWAMGHGDL